jgi:hypothetical protein
MSGVVIVFYDYLIMFDDEVCQQTLTLTHLPLTLPLQRCDMFGKAANLGVQFCHSCVVHRELTSDLMNSILPIHHGASSESSVQISNFTATDSIVPFSSYTSSGMFSI